MESRLIFLRRLVVVEAREDGEGQTSQVMDILVQACRWEVQDKNGPLLNTEK
jgi:hypothetical protein